AKAGVEAGDILLSIDGESVSARFAEEVPPILERLASAPIGDVVVLEVGRGGERHRIEVETARFAGRAGDQRAFPVWGFTARTITPEWARNRGQEGMDGVRITGVRQGGAAQQAEPAFQRRDMLRELAGRSIESVADLVALYAERTAPGIEPEPVVATLERDGHELLTVLDPRRERSEDPPRELPKAWIGVASQPLLAELAEQLGWGELRGFRITRVYPGTEAERAGLQVGDVIRAVGGEPLVPAGKQDVAMLSRRVRGLRIGETVTLGLMRDGVARTVPVVLERTRLAPEEARRHEDPDFEWTVRELTFFDRDLRRLDDDTHGVLVQTVERAGWADLGGLRPGDLITEVDGRPIRGLRSFRDAVDAVRSARPTMVPIRVLRGLRIHYREIEPDWGPTTVDGAAPAAERTDEASATGSNHP
ncbi:MAG: PDZ domain-containing protein, partial [Acidobacteriota bacterium]